MITDNHTRDTDSDNSGQENQPIPVEEQIPDPDRLPLLRDIVYVILFTAAMLLMTLAAVAYFSGSDSPNTDMLLFMEFLLIFPALFYARYRGYSLKSFFRLRMVSPGLLLAALFTGSSATSLINYLDTWLYTLAESNPLSRLSSEIDTQFLDLLLFDSLLSFLLLTFTVVIAAGLFEEMIFRGFIQQTLEPRITKAGAIIVTSALFTVLHPFSMTPIFVLAVVLGIITARCGSIFPAVLIHSFNNGLSLYALNLSESLRENPVQGMEIPAALLVLSLAVFTGGMIAIFHMTKEDNTEYR